MNFLSLAIGYALGSSSSSHAPVPQTVPMTGDDWLLVVAISSFFISFTTWAARRMYRVLMGTL